MQHIFITGASTGIGHYAAIALKNAGHKVVCSVRNEDDKPALEAEGLSVVVMSLETQESIAEGFARALKLLDGQLDLLFNNAGFGVVGAIEDIPVEALNYQFQINVFAVHQLTRLAVVHMRQQGRGRIIQNSSVLGLVTLPYRGAYCASKHALESLTDALRMELVATNIQVALIEPGAINTHFRQHALAYFKQHILTESSIHHAQYQQQLARLSAKKSNNAMAEGPEAVYYQLQKAMQAKKMKPRYFVTKQTPMAAMLKRILPCVLLDRVMLKSAN